MISKETLKAVEDGILTDQQLEEAIKHYEELILLLSCHGERYVIVRRDVHSYLTSLYGYKSARIENH